MPEHTNPYPIHLNVTLSFRRAVDGEGDMITKQLGRRLETGELTMYFLPAKDDKFNIAGHDITITGRRHYPNVVVLDAELVFELDRFDDVGSTLDAVVDEIVGHFVKADFYRH